MKVEAAPQPSEEAHANLSYVRPTPQVMLKVLPVKLIGSSSMMDAYALLDDGAKSP